VSEENRPHVPEMLQKRLAEVHLTEVRSLLSLQKLVEDLVREQETPNQDEVDVELQQQYRKELRQKLKLMPPRKSLISLNHSNPTSAWSSGMKSRKEPTRSWHCSPTTSSRS
jgi:hypothetical protein